MQVQPAGDSQLFNYHAADIFSVTHISYNKIVKEPSRSLIRFPFYVLKIKVSQFSPKSYNQCYDMVQL